MGINWRHVILITVAEFCHCMAIELLRWDEAEEAEADAEANRPIVLNLD